MLRRLTQTGAYSVHSLLKESKPALAPRFPIAAPSMRLSTPFASMRTKVAAEPVKDKTYLLVTYTVMGPKTSKLTMEHDFWEIYRRVIDRENEENIHSDLMLEEGDGCRKLMEFHGKDIVVSNHKLSSILFEELNVLLPSQLEEEPLKTIAQLQEQLLKQSEIMTDISIKPEEGTLEIEP